MVEIQKELSSTGKSLLHRYQDLYQGRRSISELILYEMIMTFTSRLPGAAGLALRKLVYPLILGETGMNTAFGCGATLRHPHKIRLGSHVTIDENCLLDAKGTSNRGISLGEGVFLGRNSILSCKNGSIHLEKDVNIGFNCEIFSASEVRVGEGTFIAAYTYLIGGGHAHADPRIPIADQERISSGIDVGKRCWIGAGSKILDGSVIGDDCIVGACSLVRGEIPPMKVVAGIPAKILRNR